MPPTELTDLDIEWVSTVDRGANKRTHALLKRDQRQGGRMAIAQDRYQKALATGIAKGRGQRGGFLAALKKVLPKPAAVAKSAGDNMNTASWALNYVTDLIEAEAADAAEDTTGDNTRDITGLRQAAELLGQYITATAGEVGSPDDLEDIAEEAAAFARAASNYYPVYMRDGGIAKGEFVPFKAAPTTKAAMDTHLTAAEPAGHGMADSKTADMSMADMTDAHDSAHAMGGAADHSHGAVSKAGQKQFSAARVKRLKEAADAFASVLAEIEAASDDAGSEETKKRAGAQEDGMITKDDIAAVAKAVTDSLETRLGDIEKRLPEAPAAPETITVAKADWDGLVSVVKGLVDAKETATVSRAVRKSLDGQEGESSNGQVESSIFAGLLGKG